jgi:hypothetical protein
MLVAIVTPIYRVSRKKQCIPVRFFSGTAQAATTTSYDTIDDDLRAAIREYDIMKPHPLNLQHILRLSPSTTIPPNPITSKTTVDDFLQEEFCIRCAERICMLEEKIPNFAEIPELQQVHSMHIQSFVDMKNRQEDFIPLVRKIVDRCRDVIPLVCKGMVKLVHQKGNDIDEAFVNKFLNEFMLNRIGSNVLLSQYLAVADGEGSSIVDPNCNVAAICREAAREIQKLCLEETGYRPIIKVENYQQSGEMENFAFIPAVITYIVRELLKNSSVATAQRKQRDRKLSNKDLAVSVIVSADEERVMIHIGDKAGGIPFDVGQHIWSYMYSTKNGGQHRDLRSATNLGGFGVGLPLSKLYASYLGGTINLVSLPGYGTHAYVFFRRLPEKMVESVPLRETGWEPTNAHKFFY